MKSDLRSISRIERNAILVLAVSFMAVVLIADRSASGAELAGVSPAEPMTRGWVGIVAVLACVAVNGLFVASATAVDLLRNGHLRQWREHYPKTGDRLQTLLDGKVKYVAACNLGSQTARLALVFVAFALAEGMALYLSKTAGWTYEFRSILGAALMIAVPVAVFNLVIGELVPKSYAAIHPARVAVALYRFIRFASLLFYPVATLVVAVAGAVATRFGGHAGFGVTNLAEEEIKTLAETAQESGEIEVDEKELLHSVFEFTDTVAREVMTPRVDLDALPVNSDPAELVRLIHESGHSRIPLYEGTDDQIVGIVHAKDLLLAMVEDPKRVSVRKLMRTPLFVPENKNLHELLTELRQNRGELAIVQDEFGGTAGIVTTEDIVEELVGDIVDEYDVDEPAFESVQGGLLIDGKTHVDDVNQEIDGQLSSEEFDTIGGFVFGLFGRQPKVGEWIDADGFRFAVTATDGRRIQRLHVSPAPVEDAWQDDALERRLV